MRLFVGLPALLLLLLSVPGEAAKPAPAAAVKPEAYLLMPEPRAMKSSTSKALGDAHNTVFTPAHLMGGVLSTYSPTEFAKLGIAWETFTERAEAAADRLLTARTPDLIKDKAGRVLYAVYRGDEPFIACLLVAPSLPQVFEKVFGGEVYLASPDRHSLYVFPAKAEAMEEFTDDLRQRYEDAAYAGSEEVFLRKAGGPLQAIATLPK